MSGRERGRRRDQLPDLLATILEARGASVSREGAVWEAALPADVARSLGVERLRFAASAGRAARGAELDAAVTERILLLGRSHGQVTRLVAPGVGAPDSEVRVWVMLHWRVRYGSDEIPEDLHSQVLPLAGGAARLPASARLRAATAEEELLLPAPEADALRRAWGRALRLLESRIRRRVRPHEDRERRELHREMRTLSTHYRSLIAEERAGRTRRPDEREADRMLELKEDWERKLAAMIRRRQMETEATLVAAAFVFGIAARPVPRRGLTRTRGAG
jgi:hypothetical protein